MTIANLVYCYIPVVLFLTGWCRWEIALSACVLLAALFLRLHKQQVSTTSLTIDRPLLIGIAAGTAVLALVFGYGGLFADFNDYPKHAALVQDLSQHTWPVIYDEAQTPSMLTYYIGSYLFPGLVGKLFSSRIVAELMLGIVGWTGMVLLFLNILRLAGAQGRKQQVWAMVIYLLFIGMLLPLQALTVGWHEDVIFGYPHWFTYPYLQYRCSAASLKWAWPQYIIPILGIILLYTHRDDRRHYALWILPALLCGTWAFVALVGYVIAYYTIDCIRLKKIHWDIISWQNIVCALIGLVFVIYLLGNLSTDKPAELQFRFISDWKYYLLSYLPFCLFMFGFYFALIWQGTKRDPFFYITLGLLCLIPLFRAGLYNDWTMGVSMPALFLLTIYCIRFLLQQAHEPAMRKRWITLIVCIALSLPYPLYELYNTFRFSGMPERTLADYSDLHNEAIDIDLRTNYFTYEYEHSVFYNYIAR